MPMQMPSQINCQIEMKVGLKMNKLQQQEKVAYFQESYPKQRKAAIVAESKKLSRNIINIGNLANVY